MTCKRYLQMMSMLTAKSDSHKNFLLLSDTGLEPVTR